MRQPWEKKENLSHEAVLDIYSAKLTPPYFSKESHEGTTNRKALAAKHDTSEANVKMIRAGLRWAWLTKDYGDHNDSDTNKS